MCVCVCCQVHHLRPSQPALFSLLSLSLPLSSSFPFCICSGSDSSVLSSTLVLLAFRSSCLRLLCFFCFRLSTSVPSFTSHLHLPSFLFPSLYLHSFLLHICLSFMSSLLLHSLFSLFLLILLSFCFPLFPLCHSHLFISFVFHFIPLLFPSLLFFLLSLTGSLTVFLSIYIRLPSCFSFLFARSFLSCPSFAFPSFFYNLFLSLSPAFLSLLP